LRARGGPLPVTEVKERPLIAEAFISAAESAGYERSADYNGDRQDGFGYYQVNQRRGRRVSAAANQRRHWRHIGRLVETIQPAECEIYFANAAYGSVKR